MSRSSVLADMGSLRFPAGSLVSQSQFYMTGSTASAVTSTTKTNFWSQAFTPSGNGGKNNTIIYAAITMHLQIYRALGDARLAFTYSISGDDITNVAEETPQGSWNFSQYFASNGSTMHTVNTIQLRKVTLEGTGNAAITYAFYMVNENASADSSWIVNADNNTTNITFTEVAV